MAQHHIGPNGSTVASRALSENSVLRTSRLKANEQGYWQIVYNIRDEKTGGWRSKTFSTKTKDHAQAESELNEWLTQATESEQATGPRTRVTITDVIDTYLMGRNVQPPMSLYYILAQVKPMLGGLTPADLTDQVIRNYKTARTNRRTGSALKDGSLRRELGALVAALNYAAKKKLIDRSVVPMIELPKQSHPRVLFMDRKQEQFFWQAAQSEGGELALFVALGLETAARKGAILGLTWDRIDFNARLIDLRDPAMKVSRKRRAVVPISDRLLPILRPHARPSGKLFSQQYRRIYDKFIERIGMPWATAHVMRHTWASHAAQDGVPLLHIAKMLGDSVKTVEETYAHLQPAHLHDIVNRPRGLAA
jgi:integrase